MDNYLLIIVIVLLVVLIGLVLIVFLKNNNNKSLLGGLDKSQLNRLLEEARVNTLKDMNESVSRQNKEINAFKLDINNLITESSNLSLENLTKFLNETKEKLTLLENNFTKQSSNVKEENVKSINELIEKTSKDINELKAKLVEQIAESNLKNHQNVNKQNEATQERITSQIDRLKKQVEESLTKGFEKSDKAMQDFIEKAATLEAYGEKIEKLQADIDKFSNILHNQKSRGNFGEKMLEQIFYSLLGNAADNVFEREVYLYDRFNIKKKKDETNIRVDFLINLYAGDEVLPISVDAKFPYVNYIPLLEDNLSSLEKEEVKKKLKRDLIKHVRDVSKYIIEGVTAPYAIMFIPSEAVFIDVYKEFKEVVEEARKVKVIISSPSLIVSIIQMLQFVLEDYQQRKHANVILEIIKSISVEFDRYVDRWETIKNDMKKINKDIKNLDITHGKIAKRFDETKNITITNSLSNNLDDEEIIDIE